MEVTRLGEAPEKDAANRFGSGLQQPGIGNGKQADLSRTEDQVLLVVSANFRQIAEEGFVLWSEERRKQRTAV
uniref:Uncharacterized protein n=1 Tax=Steinernema glaseri TaxID=37863 RepID=A0A1I7ZBW4_9BILA